MTFDPPTSQRPFIQGMHLFLLIWFGQLVSTLGSALMGFGLSVWVFQTTGSVTQLTLISFFAVLPQIICSPVAGVLVDRWELRRTMIMSDLGGAFATLILVVLLQFAQLQLWHIYVLVGIMSVFNAFQFPAFGKATTLIMPKEQLGRASGMVPLAQGIAQLVAPALAGLLIVLIGLRGVIVINFATCIVAIAILLLVRIPRRAIDNAANRAASSWWTDLTFGWTYIRQRVGLWSLLVFFATSNFITAAVFELANPLILSFASPAVLGTILSTAGVGILVGSVAMGVWGGPRRRIYGVFGSMLLSGLCMIIAGLAPSALLIGAAAFFFTLGSPILAGCSQTIWQRKVPAALQGRVFATRSMIATSTLPLSYLVIGPLADYVFRPLLLSGGALAGSVGKIIGVGPGRGIALLFIVFGILLMVLVAAGAMFPRLRLVEDEIPDALADEPLVANTGVPQPNNI